MNAKAYTAADFPIDDSELKKIISSWTSTLELSTPSLTHPKLTYIVGQPAAGKTATIEDIQKVSNRSSFVIDSDQIRADHPLMEQIMAKDPISMDVLSNGVVGPVMKALLDHARENQQSLILENTLTNTETVANTIARFREDGYGVEMYVVATPKQLSQIGILDRYARALKDPTLEARWTRPLAHQTAYNAIPKGLITLHGKVDTVIVNSRQQGEAYRGTDMQRAADTLQRLRDEDWNANAKAYFAEKYIQNQPLLRDYDFITHPYVAPLLESIHETAASIPEYIRTAQEKLARETPPTALARKLGMMTFNQDNAQTQNNLPAQHDETVHWEMRSERENEL